MFNAYAEHLNDSVTEAEFNAERFYGERLCGHNTHPDTCPVCNGSMTQKEFDHMTIGLHVYAYTHLGGNDNGTTDSYRVEFSDGAVMDHLDHYAISLLNTPDGSEDIDDRNCTNAYVLALKDFLSYRPDATHTDDCGCHRYIDRTIILPDGSYDDCPF